jgi:hypothetical protein
MRISFNLLIFNFVTRTNRNKKCTNQQSRNQKVPIGAQVKAEVKAEEKKIFNELK